MAQSDPSPLGQASRLFVLLQRLLAVRIAMMKTEVTRRFNALLVALAIALGAVVLALLALVFALLAAASALQSLAGMTPAMAYAAVAGGGVVLALLLAFVARAFLRRATQPGQPPLR